MRTLRMLLFPAVIALVFVPFALNMDSAKAATTAVQSTCNWHVVSSPNPNKHNYNNLMGISAASDNDIWAVGYSYSNGVPYQAFIEHWNGAAWSLQPNGTIGAGLSGVVTISGKNAWAVGSLYSQTLVEHWNGSYWGIYATPNPGQEDYFTGVAATSANDVWAVGYYFNSSNTRQTLVEHWDGTNWSIVASPNVGPNFNSLYSVSAIAPNNAWAVGDVYDIQTNIEQPLVEHWNGSTWSVVSTPSLLSDYFQGITAISANDIWAVGTNLVNSSTNNYPLTEHWNGSSWSIVAGPQPNLASLSSVAAVASHNVWAVGTFNSSSGGAQTLIEHWNGTQWATVNSPSPGIYSYLNGIALLSGQRIWAVGISSNGNAKGNPLIEKRC